MRSPIIVAFALLIAVPVSSAPPAASTPASLVFEYRYHVKRGDFRAIRSLDLMQSRARLTHDRCLSFRHKPNSLLGEAIVDRPEACEYVGNGRGIEAVRCDRSGPYPTVGVWEIGCRSTSRRATLLTAKRIGTESEIIIARLPHAISYFSPIGLHQAVMVRTLRLDQSGEARLAEYAWLPWL